MPVLNIYINLVMPFLPLHRKIAMDIGHKFLQQEYLEQGVAEVGR